MWLSPIDRRLSRGVILFLPCPDSPALTLYFVFRLKSPFSPLHCAARVLVRCSIYMAGMAIMSNVMVLPSKPVPGTIAFEAAGARPSSRYSGRSSFNSRLVLSSLT